MPDGSTAPGRPPDSQAASAPQFKPSAPATEVGSARVPIRTFWVTGSRTVSSPVRRGRCRTPLTVRRLYVTRRTPGTPCRSTSSVPAKSPGSRTRSTAYGTGSSRTSWLPVIRSTVTVCPSRGKEAGGTEVVSWPERVIPASSKASRTVAALVRTVRSRPSARKVTVRSVRTSRARPCREMGAERDVDR